MGPSLNEGVFMKAFSLPNLLKLFLGAAVFLLFLISLDLTLLRNVYKNKRDFQVMSHGLDFISQITQTPAEFSINRCLKAMNSGDNFIFIDFFTKMRSRYCSFDQTLFFIPSDFSKLQEKDFVNFRYKNSQVSVHKDIFLSPFNYLEEGTRPSLILTFQYILMVMKRFWIPMLCFVLLVVIRRYRQKREIPYVNFLLYPPLFLFLVVFTYHGYLHLMAPSVQSLLGVGGQVSQCESQYGKRLCDN